MYMYVVQICWCGVHVPLVQHMLLHQCTCIILYSVLVVATCKFCPVAWYIFQRQVPRLCFSLIMVILFRIRSSIIFYNWIIGFASSESDWDFEEYIIKMSACTCTTLSWVHKMDCPTSSRNHYASCSSVLLAQKAIEILKSTSSRWAHVHAQHSVEYIRWTVPRAREIIMPAAPCFPKFLQELTKMTVNRCWPKSVSVLWGQSKCDSSSFKVGDHVCVYVGRLEKYQAYCAWSQSLMHLSEADQSYIARSRWGM